MRCHENCEEEEEDEEVIVVVVDDERRRCGKEFEEFDAEMEIVEMVMRSRRKRKSIGQRS
jgi:hypothetical protein